MHEPKIKRALISVSNTKGLRELVEALVEANVALVATEGTQRKLKRYTKSVLDVRDVTGIRSLLGGLVKTLHPAVFAPILSLRSKEHSHELEHFGMYGIDLVVVNFYPVAQVMADANSTETEILRRIDIGGPALVRAAAKNYRNVTVLVDPGCYGHVVASLRSTGGQPPLSVRRELAAKAFAMTAKYDDALARHLTSGLPLRV